MRPKWIFASFACVALCSAVAVMGLARAGDEKAKKADPAAAKMDEKAMMEAWAKIAAPGEPHKMLATSVGTWDTTVKSWWQPGAPAMESKGTAENRMILGGRYLEGRFTGNMMNMPFEGLGYTGYDNYKKKYVSTWMDNMGTGIMTTMGSADPSGKTMTFTGEMDDPMEGKTKPMKNTLTIVDNDHHTFEMWSPGPDGKMAKMMEIQYTRKK